MQGVTAAFLKSRHGIYLEHPLKTRTNSMEISMTDFLPQYLTFGKPIITVFGFDGGRF